MLGIGGGRFGGGCAEPDWRYLLLVPGWQRAEEG
jgi:hypothetical protein